MTCQSDTRRGLSTTAYRAMRTRSHGRAKRRQETSHRRAESCSEKLTSPHAGSRGETSSSAPGRNRQPRRMAHSPARGCYMRRKDRIEDPRKNAGLPSAGANEADGHYLAILERLAAPTAGHLPVVPASWDAHGGRDSFGIRALINGEKCPHTAPGVRVSGSRCRSRRPAQATSTVTLHAPFGYSAEQGVVECQLFAGRDVASCAHGARVQHP